MKNLQRKLDQEYMDTTEFIRNLSALLLHKKYNNSYPKFTKREILFLTELLLHKPNDLILFYIADYLADNHHFGVAVFANGASQRRLLFFKNFICYKGNATKAAIASGYSPRSAKQQGHRLLRWIQRESHNKSLSGFAS